MTTIAREGFEGADRLGRAFLNKTAVWTPRRALGVSAVVTAAAGLVLLVIIDDVGLLRFAPNRTLRVLLEGLQASIGALVTLLVYGRLRFSRRSDDLLLAAGIGIMAATSLVVAFGLSWPGTVEHEAAEAALDWGAVASRVIAAGCLVAAAAGRQRRVAVPSPATTLAALLAVPAVAVSASFALVLRADLPDAVASNPGGPAQAALRVQPALTVLQAVLLAAWLVGAVGFFLRGRRDEDRFLTRLGIAAGLGAAARLQFLLVPSLYTDTVRVGDLLRFADHLVLAAAAVAEIRSYWAAEAVLRAQRERQRLARALHDGLVQELCFLKAHAASVAAGRSHPGLAQHVGDAVDRAYDESRRLLDVLDSPPLSVITAESEAADPLRALRIEVGALAARAGVDAEVRWPTGRTRGGRRWRCAASPERL